MKLFLMDAPFSAGQAKPLKILLADDSANIHRAVALALRKTNYELIYCDNGQDAWRIIQEQLPALVMVDLDMPGPTGREICQKIKSTSNLSGIKVVLLCGSFDEVEDQKLEALAPDGRLWKPFESHVLLSLLSTVLRAPTIRPAEKTLLQLPKQKDEKTLQDLNDPIREMTSEMIRQTFSQVVEPELPHSTLDSSALKPPMNPWDEAETHEPKISKKIEVTESLPRDISPFEKTLPPEEEAPYVPSFSPPQTKNSDFGMDDLWTPKALPPEMPTENANQGRGTSGSDLGFYREQSVEQDIVIPAPQDPSNTPTILIDRADLRSTPSLPKLPDPEYVRKIVREEIQKSFEGWFRERLEKKLKEILSDIEKD